MESETITCKKHGVTFKMLEGCPECIAERKAAEVAINPEASIAERIKETEEYQTRQSNADVKAMEEAIANKEPWLKVRPEQREMEEGLNSEGLTLVEAEETEEPPSYYCPADCQFSIPTEGPWDNPKDGGCAKENEFPLGTTLDSLPEYPLCPFYKCAEVSVALRPFEDYEAHDCFLESERVLEIAKSRVINTLEESQTANNDLALISKLTKLMDDKRKALLAPLKAESDTIRDTYKYLMAPIIEANTVTKSKMLAFDLKQKQIQQEQERINQQRLEAAQAEMNLKGELTESVNLVEVVEAPKRVRTDMGTSFKTDRWKYRIDDINQLSKEFMIPDDAQLSAIAKKHHDKKPVAGVTFYNDPYYTVRTK